MALIVALAIPASGAFGAILGSFTYYCPSTHAQFVETVAPRIKEAATGMRNYYQKNKAFPSGGQQMDELVKYLYGEVNVNPAPPNTQVEYTSRGFVRYVNICVAYDPGIANAPIEAWRNHPPTNWQGEPNDVMVMEDGDNAFLVWAVGLDAKPLREQNGEKQAMIVYEKMPKPEQDYDE
jgi:hypothetical protein